MDPGHPFFSHLWVTQWASYMANEYVVAGRDQGGKGMALNVIDGLNIGKPSAENQRITESFVPAALQALISYGQL